MATIGSINIQNVKTNKAFLQSLFRKLDIICIQEHWLFDFEHSLLQEMSDQHLVFSKCVDMNDPLPPNERIRGYGGVATFWSKSLDNLVTKHQDEGERIIVLEIKNDPISLILINAYLPARNSKQHDSYDEVLGEISEIIYKFKPTHDIIIVGDMNASLHRDPPKYPRWKI